MTLCVGTSEMTVLTILIGNGIDPVVVDFSVDAILSRFWYEIFLVFGLGKVKRHRPQDRLRVTNG